MSDSLRDQLLKAGFSQSAKSDTTRKDKAGKKRPSRKKVRTKREESAEASAKKTPSQRVYRPEDSVEKERLKKTRYRSVAPTGSKSPTKKAKKAPSVKARAGSWSSRSTVVDAQPASIQQHGELKPGASENELPDEASLEALIRGEALSLDKADQLYRFSMKNRITEIHVTNTIRDGLLKAELGIARLHDKLFVLPAKVVEDIKQTQPELAVFLACDTQQSAKESDDSGYDDFPVPDDLHW
ncbi:MAG: DUF2058 family protein [Granulosicoccus sp.]